MSKVNVNLYSDLLWCISKVLRYDPCVTRASHSFTCHKHTNHTGLHSPAACITALWLVLIVPAHKGMTRLSWPGRPVTYRDKIWLRELKPDMFTHPRTNRARRMLTLLIEINTLQLCLTMTINCRTWLWMANSAPQSYMSLNCSLLHVIWSHFL